MKPKKNTASVIRKKRLIIFVSLIFLLTPVLITSCIDKDAKIYALNVKHPGPVINRELSEKEMSLPLSQYFRDYVEERTIKVNIASPPKKPEVQWSRKLERKRYGVEMIVDSQGGTWIIDTSYGRWLYNSDEEFQMMLNSTPKQNRTLIRLNPENLISWKYKFYKSDPEYKPVVVCDGAVIWSVKTIYIPFDRPTNFSEFLKKVQLSLRRICGFPTTKISLECIDNDGNTVWRTQTNWAETSYGLDEKVFRLSKNRIMMAVGNDKSGRFNIFSLSDGALLEAIKFPEWDSGEDSRQALQPIQLPDNGWIGYQNDGIVRFDSNLKSVWKYEIAINELLSPPIIIGRALTVGTKNYLVSIDLDTGNIIWNRDEYNNVRIHGAEPSNNYIFFTSSSDPKKFHRFYNVGNNGDPIFSTNYQMKRFAHLENQFNRTIVYNDGSVLFNDRDNLNLFDKNGALVWKMDFEDLGLSAGMYNIEDSLAYAPDGRLLLCVTTDDLKADMNDYIISLETYN